MAKIIGVKFKNTAKTYYFAPAEGETDYPERSGVIVETSKGLEYATVVFGLKEVPDKEIVHPLKQVVRKATEKDEKTVKDNEKKIPEAMEYANQKIAELKLNMKLIGCADGSRIQHGTVGNVKQFIFQTPHRHLVFFNPYDKRLVRTKRRYRLPVQFPIQI